MKKFVIYAICTCLLFFGVFGFSSCRASSDSLKNEGLEIISLISEMIESDSYDVIILSGVSAYEDSIAKIKAGDYTAPNGVYEIEVSLDYFTTFYDIDQYELSERLKDYIGDMYVNSVVSMINSKNGVFSVALSSVYTATDCFVDKSISENHIYLYAFENGYPIIVSFVPYSDGAVMATGHLVVDDNFDTSSTEGIKNYLEKIGFDEITVTEK